MSNVFRAFPALKSMGENVANYITGQFSSTKGENLIFEPIFEAWKRPELAGSENTLLGPLVLEGGFGYRKSDVTLEQLAQQRLLNPTLLDMLEDESLLNGNAEYTVPRSRRPYTHQEAAFRAANQGKSILVSAGTGSGKTECFLYPIISDILNETPEQRAVRGVRAIILYPTNALIHSQEQRLIEYLHTVANRGIQGRPISFCMYNHALGLTRRDNPSDFYITNNRRDLPKIGANDEYGMPDIILTNFSMLEYILLRERDYNILARAGSYLPGDNNKTIFRHLVLDEAHTYTGSNATEIALQIRRVLLAMESAGGVMPKVQYYATSATFAGDEQHLRSFAKGLFFNVGDNDIEIIHGGRFAPNVSYAPAVDIILDAGMQQRFAELYAHNITVQDVCNAFNDYIDDATVECLGRFLWRFAAVRKIREWLCSTDNDRSYRFDKLCKYVQQNCGNVSPEMIAILLDIGSLAKFTPNNDPEMVPLLPTRWHSAFRKFEGIFACVNPDCTAINCQNHGYRNKFGKLYTTWHDKCECGAPVFPLSFCSGCGKPYLMVQRDDGNNFSTPSIRNIIGAFFDMDDENDGLSHVEFLAIDSQNNDRPVYHYANNDFYPSRSTCSCNYQIPAGDRRRHFTQTFVQNKPVFTSLVLEGLWPHLPEQENPNHRAWPSNGRHILTFSDTRQNAAQLAPIMENTFFRNCAYQLIKKILSRPSREDVARLEELRNLFETGDLTETGYQRRVNEINARRPSLEIDSIIDTLCSTNGVVHGEYLNLLGLVDLANDPSMENRKQELCSTIAYMLLNLPPNGISIENAGIVECVYPGLETCIVPERYAPFMNNVEWQDLIYTCLQSLRQRQAFAINDNNAYVENFEAIFDFHKDKVCDILSENIKENIIPAIFRDRTAAILDAPANGECELEERIKDVALEKGWINANKQIYWQTPANVDGVAIHPIQFRIRNSSIFRCRATRKVVFKSIKDPGLSPYGNQGIDAVQADQLFPRLHEIVNRTNIFACLAAEHTAQAEVQANQALEEQFRQNKINLLSSTTTMEMGIDVGALSSVMLANTPPTQANYMQRAGRAGRRGEGSSLIFTICNASPHDEMFFNSPDWAFNKDLSSPEISFKSRTLMQRAVNAWLIRCICRRDGILDNIDVGNNPTEVYSLYGKFFNAVETSDALDYLHGQNLLNEIYTNVNHRMRRQIAMLLQGSDIVESFDFASESSFIGNSIAKLSEMISKWREKVDELQNEIANMDVQHANIPATVREVIKMKCQRELDRMIGGLQADSMKDGTINYLVDHQYFPSHGLPLDVVSLNVMELPQNTHGNQNVNFVEDDTFKLTRNRGAAIRSYAPGNETVARGYRYMSLGIQVDYRQRFGLPPANGQQQQLVDNVFECPVCRSIFTYANRPVNDLCPICSTTQNPVAVHEIKVIKPEAFVTNKVNGRKKGVKNPEHAKQCIETIVAGRFAKRTTNSVFTDVKSESSSQVHILNKGQSRGFRYCTSCFRVIDANQTLAIGDRNAPTTRTCRRPEGHYFSRDPFYLYHNYTTEALMVKIKSEYRTSTASISGNPKAAGALGIALKTAASAILGIEEREIDFNLPVATQAMDCDVILYDTNVGGNGIMHLVANHIDEILVYAVGEILVGDRANHHPICSGACPKCLVSYNTQFMFNDEDNAPDRLALLEMIDYERILQNDAYIAFDQFVTNNALQIVNCEYVKNIVETAQNLKIVLPYLSSDIFNSYLWQSIRRRVDEINIKFIIPQVESEDDFVIAKELCRKFTVETVGLCTNATDAIGIYADGSCYNLLDWRNCEKRYPFEEEDSFSRWVCREHAIPPEFDVWHEPVAAPVVTSGGGETMLDDIHPHRSLAHVMTSFVDLCGIPNDIDFAHAISWVYIDNYCNRVPTVGRNDPVPKTKDALKEFLNTVGAEHLLNERNNGCIWYCAHDILEYRGPRASWVDIAQEDGNHSHAEVHDRFLRINLPNNKQFVLNLGKGFCCFVLSENRYRKMPGSYSWYIRNI